MANQHQYDDLETDYLEEEAESGFLSLMSVVIAFIAVAVFIVLAWYAYQTGTDTSRPLEEMEVVYPEEGAIREAPVEPGGWQFPNKDKSVYNIISGEQENVKVEKILPSPEQPITRPEAQTEMWIRDKLEERIEIAKTEAERQMEEAKKQRAVIVQKPLEEPAAAKELQRPPELVKQPEPAPEPKPEPVSEPVVVKQPVTVHEPVKQPEPEVVTPKEPEVKKPEPKVVNAATLTPNRLQLGAFRSNEEAKRFWQLALNKHPQLIRSKAMHIERADLGEKGTFFRVQLYPFASKAEAKALCDKLSAKGQSCFPVTR